eukprot:gb/GFBE01044639.1/.p1 GENE.gb/GFBE01044639.1/~~gb/GFBE01044639.1/.p1  ORF type:complete len:173 (+),score=61.63 gb/GFBE01044639.1/:1-519(+)
MLSEVKGLYKEKYGQDVDLEYDEDGTAWIETVGTGVPRDCRVERLEQKLAEVKGLYKQKYGADVDEEEADDDDRKDFEYDEDGTYWVKTIATGLLTSPCSAPSQQTSEGMLEEVKAMCMERFAKNEDHDSSDDSSWCIENGTPWVQLGAGPSQPSGSVLPEEEPPFGTCMPQ